MWVYAGEHLSWNASSLSRQLIYVVTNILRPLTTIGPRAGPNKMMVFAASPPVWTRMLAKLCNLLVPPEYWRAAAPLREHRTKDREASGIFFPLLFFFLFLWHGTWRLSVSLQWLPTRKGGEWTYKSIVVGSYKKVIVPRLSSVRGVHAASFSESSVCSCGSRDSGGGAARLLGFDCCLPDGECAGM